MDIRQLLKLSVVLVVVGYHEINGAKVCQLNNYFLPNIMERFVQADIVLYGKTMHHLANREFKDGKSHYVINAVYDVRCVIKNNGEPIAEQITIKGIAPKEPCAGTDATQDMKVGDHSIVALKNVSEMYTLHEIMPATKASAPALKPYLLSLSNMCDLQSWQPPFDANTNRCPICGTANFEPEVLQMYAYDDIKNCIHMWSATETNMTTCDLYMTHSIDEANSLQCIPVNFPDSCVTLVTRPLTATCECKERTDRRKPLNVGGSNALIPSIFLISATLAYFLL